MLRQRLDELTDYPLHEVGYFHIVENPEDLVTLPQRPEMREELNNWVELVDLAPENESFAECFSTGMERRNDQDGKVTLHAGVQARGGSAGAIRAEYGGGLARSGCG